MISQRLQKTERKRRKEAQRQVRLAAKPRKPQNPEADRQRNIERFRERVRLFDEHADRRFEMPDWTRKNERKSNVVRMPFRGVSALALLRAAFKK